MEAGQGRFACTRCGKCCNHSPEVELSEAAPLADVFVFRLMFRLYWLPNNLNEYVLDGFETNRSAAFYEKKRLLNTFAARKYPVKIRRDGKVSGYTKYLMISALTLDRAIGACSALNGTQCGIYDRRPAGCRSVPFHYSRGESRADQGLKAFIGTPGYLCDTSQSAGLVLRDGQIVAPDVNAARANAAAIARRDIGWRQAIAQQMNAAPTTGHGLPSLQEVEANAQFGVSTVSMSLAWKVARDIGLIRPDECQSLIELQLHLIKQELSTGRCSNETRETLAEMALEYRGDLHSAYAIAMTG